MTTLVTLRQPLELLSMSDQPVRRSKRQPGSFWPFYPPMSARERKGKKEEEEERSGEERRGDVDTTAI